MAGRSARQLPWGEGNGLEFSMAVRPGGTVLRALYWGEEVAKNFDVIVKETQIANERRAAEPVKLFVAVDYSILDALNAGKERVRVRFETRGTDALIYEVRTLAAESA